MRLELMMRVLDMGKHDKEEEDDEMDAIDLNRIINGKELVPFTYEPYTIDLRDVGAFGRDGEEHTKIMTSTGLYYARIDYSVFKHIYEAQTGSVIKTEKDFKLTRR